jgi:peptidoglycan/LPS O-acetylase OafA/YrhL
LGVTLRLDIQGIRAFAVSFVVIFHLFPSFLPGGYIGVDIFFVVSGFLITGHLVREMSSSGSISVTSFWARRVRRLLPAAFLVLAVSSILSIIFLPKSALQQNLMEILFSALYVENWHLAATSVDYLASDNAPSIAQQYWSLSVEEQFYLVWPFLVIFAAGIALKAGQNQKKSLALVLVAVFAASFAFSIFETARSQPSAYFATTTRAWEFAAGGLIAIVPALGMRRLAHSILSWFALGAIFFAALSFDATTAFPGWIALIPVLATAILIWARDSDNTWSPQFFAHAGPLQFLGNNSYSIYLWHWPLIVLATYFLGRQPGWKGALVIVAVTLLLAWLTKRFVEDPLRKGPGIFIRRVPTFAAMAAGMGIIAGLTVVPVGMQIPQSLAEAGELKAIQDAGGICLGADAIIHPGCNNPALENRIFPNIDNLRADDDNRAECWEGNWCTVGPAIGYSKRFVAVGDSHNVTFLGAYSLIASKNNWRIDVSGFPSCSWSEIVTSDTAVQCIEWRQIVLEKINGIKDLDAVIETHASQRPESISEMQRQVQGFSKMWDRLENPSTPIISILDNPHPPENIFACIDKYRNQPKAAHDECGFSQAGSQFSQVQRQLALLRSQWHLIDLSEYYCQSEVCSPVIGGVVVYRDKSAHITATYARSLSPVIEEGIKHILSE